MARPDQTRQAKFGGKSRVHRPFICTENLICSTIVSAGRAWLIVYTADTDLFREKKK